MGHCIATVYEWIPDRNYVSSLKDSSQRSALSVSRDRMRRGMWI